MSKRLSRSVRGFIRQHVHSVGELDLLMLMHSAGDRSMTTDDISDALGSPIHWTRLQLEALEEAAVVAPEGDGWRLQPRDHDLARTIDQLAETYGARRRELVHYIFTLPNGDGD